MSCFLSEYVAYICFYYVTFHVKWGFKVAFSLTSVTVSVLFYNNNYKVSHCKVIYYQVKWRAHIIDSCGVCY